MGMYSGTAEAEIRVSAMNTEFWQPALAIQADDLASGFCRLRHKRDICAAANEFAIPWEILGAIVLLETSRRPSYVQTIERLFLAVNLAFQKACPVPLVDLSVGPCQVKISTAARIWGIPFVKNGKLLAFPRWIASDAGRHTRQKVASLAEPKASVRVAAHYISQLFEEYCTSRGLPKTWEVTKSDGFLLYLGWKYNGMDWGWNWLESANLLPYALVLREVVRRLSEPL